MLEIKSYSHVIDTKTMTAINKLLFKSNMSEYFDLGDIMYVGCCEGKVLAVEVFRLEKLNGEIIPRFIHIILHPDIKRSKLAVEFLIKNERDIAKYGYKKTWAYILKERCDMATLAMKFGFKKIEEDLKSVTLIKELNYVQ
jgi:hypothetical protein